MHIITEVRSITQLSICIQSENRKLTDHQGNDPQAMR